MAIPLLEFTYRELVTGARLRVDRHILESLPWRKISDFPAAVGAERTLDAFARRATLIVVYQAADLSA